MMLLEYTIFLVASLGISHGKTREVRILSEQNFDKAIQGKEHADLTIVKFFVTWCGYCKKLKPEYEKVAQLNWKNVVVAEVNCMDHFELCEKHKIQGYPTLISYKNKKRLHSFSENTSKDITAYIRKQGGYLAGESKPTPKPAPTKKPTGKVWNLVQMNLEKTLKTQETVILAIRKPKCKTCDKLTEIFNKLADDEKTPKDVTFAQINDVVNLLPDVFETDSYPGLFLVQKDDSAVGYSVTPMMSEVEMDEDAMTGLVQSMVSDEMAFEEFVGDNSEVFMEDDIVDYIGRDEL